jgi:hypothetical protein
MRSIAVLFELHNPIVYAISKRRGRKENNIVQFRAFFLQGRRGKDMPLLLAFFWTFGNDLCDKKTQSRGRDDSYISEDWSVSPAILRPSRLRF